MKLNLKYGHVYLLNFAINQKQETNVQGRVTKALNKADARQVLAVRKTFGLSDVEGPTQDLKPEMEYGEYEAPDAVIVWCRDQINELFANSMVPVWSVEYAFDIVDGWQVADEQVLDALEEIQSEE